LFLNNTFDLVIHLIVKYFGKFSYDLESFTLLMTHKKARHVEKILLEMASGREYDIIDAREELSFTGTSFPTLVLDLDETLVHSSPDTKFVDHDYVIYDDDHKQQVKVYKRPYVDTFIDVASRYFEIIIFTASYACYCDPILKTIKHNELISKRLYNTSVRSNGSTYEKDLYLTTPSNMPHRLVMVDNSPESCISHHENLWLVSSYRGVHPDFELIALLLVLLSMTEMDDFRAILQRRDHFNPIFSHRVE